MIKSSPFFKRIVLVSAVAVSILTAACTDEGSAASAGAMVQPSSSASVYAPSASPDKFYAQDKSLVDLKPGTLVESRAVTFAPLGLPTPNKAWQIKYVTSNVKGEKLLAMATVVQPLINNPKNKLVSYQFAYDSLGHACTPSQSLTGSRENVNSNLEHALYLTGLNGLGWTMVFSDYEGPYHAFTAGVLSGRATLDAIRAAMQFPGLELAPETQIGMWGYSGGGLATAWASSLHSEYAPELNIKGAAMGGTPSDILSVVQGGENTNNYNLLFSALIGASREYPELLPPEALNSEGKRLVNAIRDGCIGGTTDGSENAANKKLADYTISQDPYNSAGMTVVKPLISLPQKGKAPTFPVYLYHEELDTLVPINNSELLNKGWCSEGASVAFQRSSSGNHISGAVSGASAAIEFIDSLMSGRKPAFLISATQCN